MDKSIKSGKLILARKWRLLYDMRKLNFAPVRVEVSKKQEINLVPGSKSLVIIPDQIGLARDIRDGGLKLVVKKWQIDRYGVPINTN